MWGTLLSLSNETYPSIRSSGLAFGGLIGSRNASCKILHTDQLTNHHLSPKHCEKKSVITYSHTIANKRTGRSKTGMWFSCQPEQNVRSDSLGVENVAENAPHISFWQLNPIPSWTGPCTSHFLSVEAVAVGLFRSWRRKMPIYLCGGLFRSRCREERWGKENVRSMALLGLVGRWNYVIIPLFYVAYSYWAL